jgi:hypothetical protein
LPSEWALSDSRLSRRGTIKRIVADKSLEKYSIHLDGKTKATKHRIARTDAGVVRSFDVFECR